MPPRVVMLAPPFSEQNTIRNMSGNASAKNAENGLRRNSLFWNRIWRSSRVSGAGRLVAPGLVGPGELEVHVLEGRAGDGQRLELLAPPDRPASEHVQSPGRR